VRPAFADVSAAYLKATILMSAVEEGETDVMPYVLAANDVGLRRFDEVPREDGVETPFLPLLERLELPKFRALVRDAFGPRSTTSRRPER
jgi:hypothetical protein